MSEGLIATAQPVRRKRFLTLVDRSTGLAMLSGLLLALPYNHAQLFALTWAGFVPLLVAVEGASVRRGYWLGLITGLCFYVSAAPWVVDFLVLFKGFDQGRSAFFSVLFWFYCAQLPALLFTCFIALRRSVPVSDLVIFPVLAVAFYAAFPMLFSVQLGESQSAFMAGIQGVAITGVFGLDFAIALANVLIFRMLLHWRTRRPLPSPAGLAAATGLALWFGYGFWSVHHWDKITSAWPTETVGLVQPGDPPVTGSAPVYPGFSRAYPPEMEMTARLASAGAKLVVWPEGLYKHLLDDRRVDQAYRQKAAALGVDVLAQDIESIDAEIRYNSVVLFGADGSRSDPYRKMKRVAFGEALPLVDSLPLVNDLARDYLGQFFRGIAAGEKRLAFTSAGLRIVPLICYETLFPVFTARGVQAGLDATAGTVLVAVSSDSWFGDSLQPQQHANASILRAVENRVPLVHVINDGPSVVALPNGRQVFRSAVGEAGGHLTELPRPPSNGGSFFTRYPYWFIASIYVCLLSLLALTLRPAYQSWQRGRSAGG